MYVLPCMMKRGVGKVVTDLEMEALPWIVWSGSGDSHKVDWKSPIREGNRTPDAEVKAVALNRT